MTPYRPRAFRFDELHRIGGVTLKCYRIGVSPTTVMAAEAQERYAQALAYVCARAPDVFEADRYPNHALGYLIVHFGAQRVWLLLHWWHGEDIVLAHLASAPVEAGPFQSEQGGPFHACVWEHLVIHHEREAWVRHMLVPTPDPETYLKDRMADGEY
ncbi:MAG: hypothetical protein AAF184_23770 [Pseudomonadota bacterium]